MKSIMTTIRNLLTNNFLLKIAALIFAAVIWITVVNVNDPTKTVTIYNVPIQILDEKIITDNNQVYTVNNKMTVNVTVTGRRSVISELTENSFSATASFKQMSATNALPVNVKLKYSLDKKVSIDNQSQTSISVEIEELEKRTYDIETNIIGSAANNYVLNQVSLAKKQIDVTAPKSVHEMIAQVRVDLDISGVEKNIEEKYSIRLYNEKGEQIKPNSDNNIVLSKSKVTVTAIVNKLKRVPVVYELTGEPRGGYDVTEESVEPNEVTISGQAEKIDAVENITITGDVLDITGISENKEVEIDLTSYLTDGVELFSDSKVKLTIKVEGDIYKNYTISSEDIRVANIPVGTTAQVVSQNIQLTFFGKEEYVSNVIRGELQPTVDLKGLEPGEQDVEIELTLPDNVNMNGKVYARVIIEKKDAEKNNKLKTENKNDSVVEENDGEE